MAMNSRISWGEKKEYSAVTMMGTRITTATSTSKKRTNRRRGLRLFFIPPPQFSFRWARPSIANSMPKSTNTIIAKLYAAEVTF